MREQLHQSAALLPKWYNRGWIGSWNKEKAPEIKMELPEITAATQLKLTS
ncbi:hypothetical protein [Eikenella sp. NML99-0057]|nr:hypothetical protein [Eikenella sp. NML99-0057]